LLRMPAQAATSLPAKTVGRKGDVIRPPPNPNFAEIDTCLYRIEITPLLAEDSRRAFRYNQA
ncbi:hypothetical protein LZ189_15960, partial [Rhodovulum sulfidophilum]|nr:hypothetical protein [Rhodovulum sulfidophilum]